MSVHASTRPTWRAALTDRAFVVHYLQMLAAMGIGMVVLGPLSMHVVHHSGAETELLLMATTMTAGMAVWMAYRRHTWPMILEMSAAMCASVAVLLPFSWIGAVTPTGLMILAHPLMFLGMVVAMLRRRENYMTARWHTDPGRKKNGHDPAR